MEIKCRRCFRLFFVLITTIVSNGMDRKSKEMSENVDAKSSSLSPHDEVMRNILRSRNGDAANIFSKFAPVSMQNGMFLKGDLHVHVPVIDQDIPEPHIRIPRKDGMGDYPAPIYPYSSDTKEPLVERDSHGAIRVDTLYDQATASWEYILSDLHRKHYNFVAFVTHDLEPERIDRSKFESFCRTNKMICFTGTETRWERHVNCEDRDLYNYVCASDGNHVLHLEGGWDRFNVIFHPTGSAENRLDPEYYTKRRDRRHISGIEAGTPYMIEQKAIEIFANWYYELEQSANVESEVIHDEGFVARDTGVFSFNKWDAALSRGNILWATAGSCAYSKSHSSVQLDRLGRREDSEQDEDDDILHAIRIRSTRLGKGHVRVFIPNSEAERDMDLVLKKMERGKFYSVVLLSERSELMVQSIVFESNSEKREDMHFSIQFSSNMDAEGDRLTDEAGLSIENLKCSAITDHGRIVVETITPSIPNENTVEISVNPYELCRTHAFSVNSPCTYVRIHCLYYNEDHYVFQPVFDLDRVKTLQNRFCSRCDEATNDGEGRKGTTSVVHNGLLIKQSSNVCCKPSNPMHRKKLFEIDESDDRMKVKSLFKPFEKTNSEFYETMLRVLGISSSSANSADLGREEDFERDGLYNIIYDQNAQWVDGTDRCVAADEMSA